MSTDSYVFLDGPTDGGDLDLSALRGCVIADAHVRYRRMREHEVRLGFASRPLTPDERDALQAVRVSIDDDCVASTADADVLAATQRLFARLVEADLAYRRGDAWYLRSGRFNAENDRRIDELDGWDKAARKSQRALLKRVDGFELEAKTLDGTSLTLFTAHPEEISAAEFVGLSPQRPEIDAWLEGPVRAKVEELRSRDWAKTALDQLPVVELEMSAQVPGVAAPLPILISPAVDARFGPAAILGIPSADDGDRNMARTLARAGGLAWKVESKPPKVAEAARYLTDDMPLADGPGEGDPVPTVSPHPRFVRAWLELAAAVPAAERADAPLDHADLAQLVPTTQTVASSEAALALLDMRTLAKALRDVGMLGFLESGEPLGPTMMHAPFEIEGVQDAQAAVAATSGDGLRFALLHAASPVKPFRGSSEQLRSAAAFLGELDAFLAARVDAAASGTRIDDGDGLRRRLAGWCDTAIARIGDNYLQLDMHRATRNLVELTRRIEDFEARVTQHRGAVAGPDAEAVQVASAILMALADPVAPGLAERLGSGDDRPAWPNLQREPAAA